MFNIIVPIWNVDFDIQSYLPWSYKTILFRISYHTVSYPEGKGILWEKQYISF